ASRRLMVDCKGEPTTGSVYILERSRLQFARYKITLPVQIAVLLVALLLVLLVLLFRELFSQPRPTGKVGLAVFPAFTDKGSQESAVELFHLECAQVVVKFGWPVRVSRGLQVSSDLEGGKQSQAG